jgi:glyoxylase-like metal-dependent hydrolase (beta-lactamase superfamily II)
MAGAVAMPPAVSAQENTPETSWTIRAVRGDLYRVDAGRETGVFLVTSEGIVLVDPLGPRAAAWLNGELQRRFPDQPVRHVVYSRYHYLRTVGGSVFGNGAKRVAQDTFVSDRQKSGRRWPDELAALDLNSNGRLERSEARATWFESVFMSYDYNKDNAVSLTELFSFVSAPDTTYRDRRTITIGGRRVELIHLPHTDAEAMTAVYFPHERVLFIADGFSFRALPRSIGAAPKRTIEAASIAEALDVDTIVTGTGDEGSKGDLSAFKEYLQQLYSGVRSAYAAGRTVQDVQRTLTLDTFSGFANFSTQREQNIADVYATMRPMVLSIHASTHVDLRKINPNVCQPQLYDRCESTGNAPYLGGTLGLNLAVGRLIVGGDLASGLVAERRVMVTDDFFDPEEFVAQHRDVALSFVVGYEVVHRPAMTMSVNGGPSIVFASHRTSAFLTTGSGSEAWTRRTFGLTVGATIVKPIATRAAIIVPVRLMDADRGTVDVGRKSFTAAVGMQFNLSHGAF